jgi:Mg2+ and Co2+ transporter CorA
MMGQDNGFRIFDTLEAMTKAVTEATGTTFDFKSVVELQTEFLQTSEQYLILNVKDFEKVEPDNLLFLTGDKAFLYAKRPPSLDGYKPFEKVCSRSYGRSTILAFLTLSRVMDSYKSRLETLINIIRELEQEFDSKKYRDLSFEFERLTDRLEEFHDLLLRLQERGAKEIETRYISFDYDVLIAESTSLLERCNRRANLLKEVGRDHELQVTMELNQRIEHLNNVMKRLTAITVILMLPTLIASHFGMNFTHMPELKIWWMYPAVVGIQVVIVIVFLYIFRKIDWL